MRFARPVPMVAVLALVVAACGGSASTVAPSTTGAGSGEPAGVTAAPAAMTGAPAAAGGSCSVQISGAVTASFQAPQDAGTLQMDYWLPDDARAMLGVTGDDEGFLLNCQGAAASVSLSTADGTTSKEFPEGAGTYTILAQATQATAAPGAIQTLVNTHDKNIWSVSEPGTFTVTTLTGGRFAGSFEFKISAIGNAGTAATVSGSFDLSCVNGACS
jgi:hypothetical protein